MAWCTLASAHLAGGDGPVQTAAPDHYQVVIHLDRDLTAPESTLTAILDDGTGVSAETLRRVACDGGVVVAAIGERGDVLDVGRRTGPFRRRSAVLCGFAIGDVGFLAARTSGSCTATTSNTGCTEVVQRSKTSS
jgi:hypothetical protein